MEFFIAGGRPNHVRETFMIKDSAGCTATTKEYINNNIDSFNYSGKVRMNSQIVYVYRYLLESE